MLGGNRDSVCGAELEIQTACIFHRGQLPLRFAMGERAYIDGYLEFSKEAKKPDVSVNFEI